MNPTIQKYIKPTIFTTLVAGIFLFIIACGGSSTNSNDNPYGITETGPGVLSVLPLDRENLIWITPLGKLAPPGHVLPTDHVYIMYKDPWGNTIQDSECLTYPIYAAGSGVVTFIIQTEAKGDTKVIIQMTKTFMYYYDHVKLDSSITVGTKVTAGQQIGTTINCPSIDLGTYDLDVSPSGYLKPERYGEFGAHTVSPFLYFTEELRTFLYEKSRVMEGVPYDKDGRVDWGIAGKLSGDWFHSSIASAEDFNSSGPDGWAKTIAFAYDYYDGTPRISIGGTITTAGVLSIASDNPDPATVSTSNGIVAYHGTPTIGQISAGWVLVQMLTDESIKIEYFAEATNAPTEFTTAAQVYVR